MFWVLSLGFSGFRVLGVRYGTVEKVGPLVFLELWVWGVEEWLLGFPSMPQPQRVREDADAPSVSFSLSDYQPLQTLHVIEPAKHPGSTFQNHKASAEPCPSLQKIPP